MTTLAPEAPSFTPSSVQQDIYWDDRPTLVFVGGRGSGKSTAACLRIRGMVERGEIAPGERVMICGPDYTQLGDGTINTFDYWFEDLIIHKADGNKPKRILRGGIEVMIRSAMNPDQTRSKECRVVWLDEVAQMEAEMHNLAQMNLRSTGIRQPGDERPFQLILTTTPRGQNWLYRMYGDYLLDSQNNDPYVGAWRMTTLEAHDEGVVTDAYLARAKKAHAPGSTMWKQEISAEFVSWSGLVYSQNYKLISATNPLPKLVYTCGAMDLGQGATPSCMLVGGIDERGAIWIIKERYESRIVLNDWARLSGELSREHMIRKWAVDNDLMWKMMKNAGVNAGPPNKTKDAAGFMKDYINNAIAQGSFNIDPECRGLISEMGRYEFKDKTSGDEVTFLDTVKPNQDDHALDTMRYLVKLLTSWKAAQGYGQKLEFAIG